MLQSTIIAACLVHLAVAQSATLTANLGYATYQSDLSLDSGVTSFLGIRFAAPPVGQLRWQAPQPPASVSGIQNATTVPPECLQGYTGVSSVNPFERRSLLKRDTDSEDCLFLNVHTPSNISSNASLPVVFWIHGGGYTAGNASGETVQDLVKESDYQVVSVSIQYRLGLFGFLAGQEVKDGGALNAGLLDQQFALQWVQDHIAAFGGDPQRVTIWGESAGAGSVLQHVVAHGGSTQPPLFRAAMMSSSFLPFQYDYSAQIPQKLYSDTVEAVNCTKAPDTLACLRSADIGLLSTANVAIAANNFYGTYAFVPVVDGSFIVERPTVTLNRSQFNGEALLAVTNSFEGNVFVNATFFANATYSLADYVSQLFEGLNESQIQDTVDLYSNVSSLPDTLSQAEAVMGESIFICPTYYTLQAFGANSWKGEFAVPPATHGQDVYYYFESIYPTVRTFNNTDFLNAFSGAFLDFAVFLNESDKINGSNITPQWPTWVDGYTEMLFNQSTTNEPVVETIRTDEQLLKRCEWWGSLGEIIGQ